MAGQDPAGGGADVGAAEVGADALAELVDHLFTEADVRTRGADLGAELTQLSTPAASRAL